MAGKSMNDYRSQLAQESSQVIYIASELLHTSQHPITHCAPDTCPNIRSTAPTHGSRPSSLFPPFTLTCALNLSSSRQWAWRWHIMDLTLGLETGINTTTFTWPNPPSSCWLSRRLSLGKLLGKGEGPLLRRASCGLPALSLLNYIQGLHLLVCRFKIIHVLVICGVARSCAVFGCMMRCEHSVMSACMFCSVQACMYTYR